LLLSGVRPVGGFVSFSFGKVWQRRHRTQLGEPGQELSAQVGCRFGRHIGYMLPLAHFVFAAPKDHPQQARIFW
jgi:hypothetical protein